MVILTVSLKSNIRNLLDKQPVLEIYDAFGAGGGGSGGAIQQEIENCIFSTNYSLYQIRVFYKENRADYTNLQAQLMFIVHNHAMRWGQHKT